jgi:adenylosuccinate synthase
MSHTFSQFGSGTFARVLTYIGPEVIISPLFMVNEANHLISLGLNPWKLLKVDGNCLITTVYHQGLNRHKELARGDQRHGSCGLGIGATREHALLKPDDALRMKDLIDRSYRGRRAAINKLTKIQHWACSQTGEPLSKHMTPEAAYIYLVDASLRIDVVDKMPDFKMAVFEGAQGMLLDENHGYHPYTTWSTVTLKHAGELLLGTDTEVNVVGCIRSYLTRHGEGTFLSYNKSLSKRLTDADPHNLRNEWQGNIRYGLLDLNVLAFSKAALGGKLHSISLSCLDHINRTIPVLNGEVKRMGRDGVKKIVEQFLAPVVITGYGPCHTDRQMTELSWHPVEEAIDHG